MFGSVFRSSEECSSRIFTSVIPVYPIFVCVCISICMCNIDYFSMCICLFCLDAENFEGLGNCRIDETRCFSLWIFFFFHFSRIFSANKQSTVENHFSSYFLSAGWFKSTRKNHLFEFAIMRFRFIGFV